MLLAHFNRLTRPKLSLFGLPILIAACFLPGTAVHPLRLLIASLAFFCARTAGMAFNQLIDRKFDALNPRTKDRVIASGTLSVTRARLIAWGFLALFLLLASFVALFWLALAAAFLIYLYSYTKRFWWGCHFVLGAIHALAPLMAYRLMSEQVSMASLFLGLAAGFLIAGNDIMYGCQDVEFDRRVKLHSIPARLGAQKALSVMRLCHLASVLCLVALGFAGSLPLFFYLCPVLCCFWLFRLPLEQLFLWGNTGVSLTILIFTAGARLCAM